MLKGVLTRTSELFTLSRFEVVKKEALLFSPNGKRASLVREGLSTGPAVSIVPYFRHPGDLEWYIVLVSQYRPMVNEVCLEAPGSLMEPGLNPEEQMVKVAKEETNINVPENCIRLTDAKWLANSFSDQRVWLGTVQIQVTEVESFKKGLHGRTNPDGVCEINEVGIYKLRYILENLDYILSYTLTSYQILELGLYVGMLRFGK